MGMVLLTVAYGKEDAAATEALDILMPHDPNSSAERPAFGGLVLVTTALDQDVAAGRIFDAPTSFIRSISPVDIIVKSDIRSIMEAVGGCLPAATGGTAAVRCARRGRAVASSLEVERAVGNLLLRAGYRIDLTDPSTVVHIDIIGERTAISIRQHDRFFKKGVQG